ncbi:MAG: sterol desaturase family protein [Acidimicrobiia bacterium]
MPRGRVYLPACAFALGAGVLVAIGWVAGWGGVDFSAQATRLNVIFSGPATLGIIAAFMVIERLRPAQRRPWNARGYRQDLLFAVVHAALVPLVVALTLAFTHVLQTALPWIVLPRMGAVPRVAAIVAILVLMDGCNWFVHLMNHRVRMLWRFHELHHSQEDMSVLTVFRTHPLIHVSHLLAVIPGIVLFANGALSVSMLVGYGAIVAFAHSNTNLGFGPLERIFVSPNFHRIHHRLDGRQDVNLGFTLTIWDQMFGTAVFPTPESVRADTGIPGRPLVVEQEGARARHLSVLGAQLVAPFRPLREAPVAHEPVELEPELCEVH